MRPASSVTCGFAGSVVSCGAIDKVVRIRTVVEQPELEKVSRNFETSLESTNVIDFCKDLASKARDKGEAQLWGFMQVIFETNARQELLQHLGFDPTYIAGAAAAYSEDSVTNGVAAMSIEGKNPAGMSRTAEEMVKKALLVGNFDAAVECCFRTGNLADALVLASCGGADLWNKAQARYFESQSSKRPFLSIVSAIIHGQLDELVQQSDPKKWQETLAILSTYAKSDEFPKLCIALGDLLEGNGDARNASLCYMCALSLERAVRFWRLQLEAANQKAGQMNYLALHEFVVKVSVFLRAVGNSAALEPEDAELFSVYAHKLSEQGLLVTAAKYCRGVGLDSMILRDRLYRSKASPKCLAAMGGLAPEFPFVLADVRQSRGQTTRVTAQQKQTQSGQESYQPASSSYSVQQYAQQQYTQQPASVTAHTSQPTVTVS